MSSCTNSPLKVSFFHAETASEFPIFIQAGKGDELNEKIREIIRQDLYALHPVLYGEISFWNRRFDRMKTLNVPYCKSPGEKLRLAEWVLQGFELARLVNEFLVNNPWSICDAYHYLTYKLPVKAMYDVEGGPSDILDPLSAVDYYQLNKWLEETRGNLSGSSVPEPCQIPAPEAQVEPSPLTPVSSPPTSISTPILTPTSSFFSMSDTWEGEVERGSGGIHGHPIGNENYNDEDLHSPWIKPLSPIDRTGTTDETTYYYYFGPTTDS